MGDWTDRHSPPDIARIAVAQDQWVDGIRILPWRRIDQRPRDDERGEPLVGVAVRVLLANISAGSNRPPGIATTDDRHGPIGSLKPSRYSVAVL